MSELKKYMHEVSSLLECSNKEKEYYLSIIKNDFDDEEDQLSYEELVNRLGSPQEWVDSHLDIVGGTGYENKIPFFGPGPEAGKNDCPHRLQE